MICPRCQTLSADTAAFCLRCGQPLTQPMQSIAPGQSPTPPATGPNTPSSTVPISGGPGGPGGPGGQSQQSPYSTTPTAPVEPPYPAASLPPTYPTYPTYPTDPASQSYSWPSQRRGKNPRSPFASTIIGILIGILLVIVLATVIVVGANKGLLSGVFSVFGANPTVTTGASGLSSVSSASSAPTATTVSPTNTARPASTIIYQSTLLTPAAEWEPDQNCFFASDGFHIKPNLACQSPVRGLSNVDVSVQMRQISGSPTDQNGIEVRRSGDPASLYEFDIDATGGWLFKKCIRSFDNCATLVSGSDPAIHTGIGAVNTLEIRAVGSRFSLLTNGALIGQISDASLSSGDVWLDTGGHAECVFTYFIASRPT